MLASLGLRKTAASRQRGFVRRHPALAYFALTFALSWGGMFLVLGPGAFTGGADPNDARLPFLFLAMYAGPTTAGLLMIGLIRGATGFRDLRSRLLTWRVAVGWYAVALLTAPVLIIAVLLALSRTSPGFLPGIVTAGDKASLLLIGILAGLMTGVFEEIGWTQGHRGTSLSRPAAETGGVTAPRRTPCSSPPLAAGISGDRLREVPCADQRNPGFRRHRQ